MTVCRQHEIYKVFQEDDIIYKIFLPNPGVVEIAMGGCFIIGGNAEGS